MYLNYYLKSDETQLKCIISLRIWIVSVSWNIYLLKLFSTIVERKLTNSMSDKKEIHSPLKPEKVYIVNSVQSYAI